MSEKDKMISGEIYNANYDEELIKSHLERAYRGAILAAQEETK